MSLIHSTHWRPVEGRELDQSFPSVSCIVLSFRTLRCFQVTNISPTRQYEEPFLDSLCCCSSDVRRSVSAGGRKRSSEQPVRCGYGTRGNSHGYHRQQNSDLAGR